MEIKSKQRLISFRVSNQGFTIVELLVGMAVSLLAMGAIYSTFLSQHKSYLVQEETAAMQQNLRAAMFYMQREIRMAGCDPLNNSVTLPSQVPIPTLKQGTPNYPINQIIEAKSTSIVFMEDVRGDVGSSTPDSPDGDVLDPNEIIEYSLNGGNLARRNLGGGYQPVAQNIDALDFVYLDGSSPPAPITLVSGSIPAGNLSQIRSVEITIVARVGRGLLPSINNNTYLNQRGAQILGPQGDNLSRRRLTTVIKCRNLGL